MQQRNVTTGRLGVEYPNVHPDSHAHICRRQMPSSVRNLEARTQCFDLVNVKRTISLFHDVGSAGQLHGRVWSEQRCCSVAAVVLRFHNSAATLALNGVH